MRAGRAGAAIHPGRATAGRPLVAAVAVVLAAVGLGAAPAAAHTPEEKAFYLQSRVVLRLNPADTRARNAVGVWHLEYGELDDAGHAFDAVLERAPADPVAVLGRALILEIRGQPTGALARVASLRPPAGLAGFAALVRGRLLVRLERLDAAAKALAEAAALKADAHDVWLWRGRLHEARGRPDLAEAAYRQAIEAGPFWPEAYARLGSLLEARGEHEQAREVLQGVLNLDNPSPYPNNDVGTLWRWVLRPAAR